MSTFGLNISGGEFGGTAGTHGINYWYPTFSDLKHYADKGVDFIRLPIRWERVQDALDGPLDLSGDVALIKQVLVDAAALGMNVIIDVHNYGRYKGVAIGAAGGPTSAQFADFWKKMAIEFKDYPAIAGYDLMNEPNKMPSGGAWKAAAQAATNAIRTVDMDTIIYIEGEGWSAAHTWTTYNNNLIINDPAGKLIYQAHGYYDDNNSGTYNETYEGEGAHPMVGVDRLTPFVEWLKAHNLKGMIGEFGVPSSDPRWLEVQMNALDYMRANDLDATAWGGGPWGTDYHHYTTKPGVPDSAYMDLLEAYFNEYRDPFDNTPAPAPQAPTVTVSDATVNEAAGFLVFIVKRSGDLSLAASVDYTTADGTAAAGSDYTAVSGTVSFAAGQTVAIVTVPLNDDTLVENPETLFLNLTNGANVTIADAQGAGTVNSDDTGIEPPAGFPRTPTILGTDGDDKINARSSTIDYIDARGGNDSISGVWSKDFIDGGTGIDTISYHWSSAYVDVDLMRAAQVNGDAEGDVLLNIENITGSNGHDILRGDDGDNVLSGLGRSDTMSGRGGADRFVFTSALHSDGDVVTDYSAADTLDFSAFNPTFLAITNDGVDTRIVGDSNGDGVGDFTVILNGVHTAVNGVSVGSLPPPPPAPTVTINDVTADETAGVLTFTITRSGSLTLASTANFTTADGTATAGSDYVAANGTVSFAAGQATATVTVQIINDALVESPETLFLNLTAGTNATITDAQGVGTINSEDVPPPAIAVADVAASEAGGPLVFTITRSGDLSLASTVNFATAEGTATAGSDYTAQSGTISFAAGQATATVTVQLINDTLVESPETLFLNLTAGTNATIADSQGVGTINSDDTGSSPPTGFPSSPTIVGTDGNNNINARASVIDYVDAKGGDDFISGVGGRDYIDGGTGSDTISYHWSGAHVDVDLMRASQRNGDANGDVLVNIENIRGSNNNDLLRGDDGANVINGLGGRDTISGRGGADRFVFTSALHANGDVITDYSAADTLDFSAFSASFLSITNDGVNTRLAGDSNNDGVEDFIVTLNGVHTAVNGVVLGPRPPSPPAPAVAINDVTADETAGALVFTITRSGDLTLASAVNFATAEGTATAGSDYVAANGTVSFAAGQATATVTVQVINDTLIESPETLFLNLTAGTNATIADAQGVGTINSDDTGSSPPTGFPSSPTIVGTDGNNNINARASVIDYVDAKGGDDFISGVGGRDYIDGGTGSDTISYHWSGAHVDVDLMRASQRNGDANGDVLVNIENIRGSNNNDLLRGDDGANVITGLGGRDTMSGRGGADRFVFTSALHSDGDVITDFTAGDTLDFSAIDADIAQAGDQAFTWLDTGEFTGSAGQLREFDLDGVHYVAGDVDGDKVSDFVIKLTGTVDLGSGDFLF